MSDQASEKALGDFLGQFDELMQERILRYALDHVVPKMKGSPLALELRKVPAVTVPDDMQEWKGMDGAIAFHLIERHADNWSDAGKMMNEWLVANAQDRAAGARHLESPSVVDPRAQVGLVGSRCSNCGKPEAQAASFITDQAEDGEWFCSAECKDQHDELGCPHALHSGYRHPVESRRLIDCENVLRSLASWLGVGGYNAPIVDAKLFEEKIRWGVDHEIKARSGLKKMMESEVMAFEPRDGGWYLVRYEGLDGVLEVPAQRRHNHWNSVSFSGIPLSECKVVSEILIPSAGGDRRVSDPDAADIISGAFMISRARSYEMMADALNASGYWFAKFKGPEGDASNEGVKS